MTGRKKDRMTDSESINHIDDDYSAKPTMNLYILHLNVFLFQSNILLNATTDKSASECHLGALRQSLHPNSHLNCIAVKG